MQNNELETIAAAMQEALHRAYALGRSDALRRVVEMVQSDELGSKTVPLLSHSQPSAIEASHADVEVIAPPENDHHDGATHAEAQPGEAAMSRDGAHNDNAEAAASEHGQRKPPGSVKDFLLDYLYPLGAKK